jgi:DNA-binding response OmpR family regulator
MKPHILVVDDSLTVRMDLRGALSAAGFDVTVCDTKRAADELLDQRTFAAAVLDVMLPDGDGVTILQRLRTDPNHTNTAVIMLSVEADVRDRVRGLTMGADEYIGKPYNIAYFIRCLRELCRRSRPSTTSSPPPSIAGCGRILAVDDSPTFLAHLARMLREDGHDVVLASSGREALDMLAVQTIDCVVVDLHMPVVDGIETVRRIRQIPGRESTLTLILTASENPQDQRNARAAGVDDYFCKTVTLDIVRAKIRNLLRRKHAENACADSQNTPGKPAARSISPMPARVAASPSMQHRSAAATTRSARVAASQPSQKFCALFLEVATVMGLDASLARDSLARTLERMNIDPRQMTEADLSRALPALEDTLTMFFPADEVALRSRALASLASRHRHPVA